MFVHVSIKINHQLGLKFEQQFADFFTSYVYFDKSIQEMNTHTQARQVIIKLVKKTHMTVNKTLFTHFAFPLISDGNIHSFRQNCMCDVF